ncbi:MAG: bifunctional phosphoribosylaminoimidazolecarboxamide formyltransferase/IMP cyclohydrolase [Nitrospiria bacterium]
MVKIQRAILSVYHKEGIVDLAQGLQSMGVEILSTGGTYALLKEKGINAREIAEYTGFPEMLDGRVKTLHPRVHGGILGKRGNAKHQEEMDKEGIVPIDLVVVNLYPFKETIAKLDVTLEEAIENIDIGGPTMLRSAAKNYKDVTVVVDPGDYGDILDEMKKSSGSVSESKRFSLAAKVFSYTSDYDGMIFSYLGGLEAKAERFPDSFQIHLKKVQGLRYGENPHQEAALYHADFSGGSNLPRQLWGKEMSYNNYLDTEAAYEMALSFQEQAAVVVKHNNPCGVATGATLAEAYRKARATDPTSAFGGVAAFNRTIDGETAEEITSTFMEVVIAPGIDTEALPIFQKKKNLRVLEAGARSVSNKNKNRFDIRCLSGGMLIQDHDDDIIDNSNALKVVSQRIPSEEELAALLFAWKVCKQVKSNAIIYARSGQTVGIGAGQMSRVDSVKIAQMKAQQPLEGCVMASDAFFPFRDAIDAAAKAGIVAVVQPGGSIRDKEVIQAIDEHKMAMVFTGMRHFKH